MHYLLSLLVLAGVGDPVPDATTTKRGYVNTKAQAFSGLKHFDGGIWTNTINGAPHAAAETVANVTLYISPDGGNAGPCTQAAPCQTLNGALRLVPKRIGHVVQILPAAGTYPPEQSIFSDFVIAENGTLEVLGSWQTATGIDGGTTSGTLSAVSSTNPFITITDATQTWGTDTVKGKFVRIVPDGGIAVVVGNSATTLTLSGANSGKAAAVADAYELIEPAVIFVNDGGTSGSVETITVRSISGRVLSTTPGNTSVTTGRLTLSQIHIVNAGAAFTAASVGWTHGPRVEFNDVRSTGNGGLTVRGPTDTLSLNRSAWIGTGTSASLTFISDARAVTGTTFASGSATTGVLRVTNGARVGWGFAQNTFIEGTATGSIPVVLAHGSIYASSTASNTGLVLVCPGGSTGSALAMVGGVPSSLWTPSLAVRGCGTALRIEDDPSWVYVSQRFEHTADGGTPLAVSVSRGARLRMTPAPVFSGLSDELRIDGTVVDGGMATLNAATLQVLTGPYGSYISR